MPGLEIIRRQPDFPNEDLSKENIPFMEYYLKEMHESKSHARHLEETLRPLHLTAHHALQLSGIEVVYSPEEYESFCKGFAALEYISLIVNPRHVREQLVVQNVHTLLTATGIIPEIEMADRRAAWVDMYPNVNEVVVTSSVADEETLPQLYSRAIGAQVACELQMTA